MLIKFKRIDKKTREGQVDLILQDTEDVWHFYNLVSVGDSIKSVTKRKVQQESATGTHSSHRVKTTVVIKVEFIDFYGDLPSVRLRGKNIVENEWIKMGAYHTVELTIHSEVSLAKSNWDSVALEMLDHAANPHKSADLSVVLMQEGVGYVFLITPSMVLTRAKIETPVPRKQHSSADKHQQGVTRFFEAVYQSIALHIDFKIVKCVVLASPGFLKDQFHAFLIQTAVSKEDKNILENKAKFVLVHSSSGHKHALDEIFTSAGHLIQDTRAAQEMRALDTFTRFLDRDPDKVAYGMREVSKADELLAVDTLLVSDSLFRSHDMRERHSYVRLVESVREHGGKTRIFSSSHTSGEKLKYYTGIAAILRCPIPDLDEML
eukprot:TRINITY_DN6916_c1_g1_i1.p1 TRINITY_DN6916_c1_g1~~TRINITY_DN6916_c1_g1_i1.p1  ORF type:complete len:377 (-),score=74.35 TRINITY_DN6916_c1_g1_i1:175-1305(-)